MIKCVFKEVRTVTRAANRLRRLNRGVKWTPQSLSSSLEAELGMKEGTFDLAMQISGENNSLKPVVERMGIDTELLLNEFTGRSLFKTNVSEEATTYNTNDLFHGNPTAKKYFNDRTNRQIVNMAFIGDAEADTYVSDNATVSKNMQHLKNDLFVNIQKFLISENSLPGVEKIETLFDENYNLKSVEHYNRVMNAATDYFFNDGNFTMLKSPAGKRVPNISKNIKITDSIYDAYSDFIFLNNMDTVINNDFGHILKINGKFLDSLEGSPTHDKYYIKADPKTTQYWSGDAHADEGAQNLNSETAKMLISTIPAHDKMGRELPIFMENNDIYLLSAVIANFELLHGNDMFNSNVVGFDYITKNPAKQLEWYLDTIVEVLDGESTIPQQNLIKQSFENYSNIVYSLHRYLNDSSLNIPTKEKNADISIKDLLGQVMNNSFGAIYHVYNTSGTLTEYQVYSQDFSATGLQDTTLTLLKSKINTPNFYSLDNKTNLENFEALFNDVSNPETEKMKNVIYNNTNFYTGINEYINNLTGLQINRNILLDSVDNLSSTMRNSEDITVNQFKTFLNRLQHSLHTDFSDNIKLREGESNADRTKRLNSASTGQLLTETVNDRLFKVLTTETVARFPIKSMSNIHTLTGEAIPVYRLANLTMKDVDLFDSQRRYQKSNRDSIYRNMFLESGNVLKGTAIKLEIIQDHTKGRSKNKRASDMIAAENMISDFNYGFLESILKDDPTFNVMIGNYSDKGTILTKIINANWANNNNVKYKDMSVNEIAEVVRTQGRNYYTDTLRKVFNDYTEIFKVNNIEHEPLRVSISQSDTSTETSIQEINRILSSPKQYGDIHELVRRANRPDIKIMEELHYSRYDSNTRFNQLLADNYRIFSSESLFKKFKNIQESNFEKKLYDTGSKNEFLRKITRKHLDSLNIKGELEDFRKVRNDRGTLNPVIGKWLWLSALARNEYLYMSTKGEYMHPQHGSPERFFMPESAPSIIPKTPRVYLSGENSGESLVKRSKTMQTSQKILGEIKNDSKYLEITEDERYYRDTRTGDLYERVSDFTEDFLADKTNPNVKYALRFGNRYDALGRDFFEGNVNPDYSTYKLGSDQSVQKMLGQLQTFKNQLDANNETVIANDITLVSKELGLAGTVDLITYDNNGNVRIYDFKTMKDNNFDTHYYPNGIKEEAVKYDSTHYGTSKREQHTNQLSLYRIIANNSYGLNVVRTAILPAVLNYVVDYNNPDVEPNIESMDLLTPVDLAPKNVVEGKHQHGKNQKIATIKNLEGESTSFNRDAVARNTDKLYIYANNDGYTDQVKGLENTIGISVAKSVTVPKIDNTVTYTPTGKRKQTYTIQGSKILNSKGKEVFKNDSADRRKIYADHAVNQGRAVVVRHGDTDYVVNDRHQIISTKTGNLVYKNIETGVGKSIIDLAIPKLNSLKSTPNESSFTDSDFTRFKKHVDSMIRRAVNDGREIVIPQNMGEELRVSAPKLYEYLQTQLNRLRNQEITPDPVSEYSTAFSDSYWQEYMNESSNRLVVMSKRNVTNTSTFEVALRDSILGTNPNVNIAAVQDWQATPYSITGQRTYNTKFNSEGDFIIDPNQDAHDGYSWMNYAYSKMVDASYPGKGYDGTKKRFGTLVTDYGVVVKKDSEGVITNEKIRNSRSSDIALGHMHRKMLNVDLEGLNLSYSKNFGGDYYYNYLGDTYSINTVNLHTNSQGKHILDLNLKVKRGESWEFANRSLEVDNLYKIWEAFGAEYSTDETGINYTEGSNDLLYDLVVHAENTNSQGEVTKGKLKDRMIHIVSNQSALKAGATNVNTADVLSRHNDSNLSYASFEGKFMGIQLDASADVEGSQMNEVTQIISALAQSGFTHEKAREAYQDIKNIISEATEPYIKYIQDINNAQDVESKDRLMDRLADGFIKSVENSDRDEIGKSLIMNLKRDGIKIPFSNQNFYNSFVKNIITKMNTDFITRKYTGIGAILAPSEGIFQLYDRKVVRPDGTVEYVPMTQQDVVREALAKYDATEYSQRVGKEAESNSEIINDFIERTFPNEVVTLDTLQIGDSVLIGDQIFNLKTPEQYYLFKDRFDNNPLQEVTKVYNRPRDLKPTLHSFTHNGVRKNVFDFQSVKFRYILENMKNPEFYSKVSDTDKTILTNLLSYLNNKFMYNPQETSLQNIAQNSGLYNVAREFLHRWTQRNYSLLSHNLTTSEVDINTDFSNYFSHDNITTDILKDVIHLYENNVVTDVTFRNAESVLGDMYSDIFNRSEADSLYDINTRGSEYFKEKLMEYLVDDNTDADLKVITSKSDTPVYIKYVSELPHLDNTINLFRDWSDSSEARRAHYVRKNSDNSELYRVPNLRNVVVGREGNSDIIYIKWANYKNARNEYRLNDHFEKNLNTILRSFGDDVKMVVPLMRDNPTYSIFTGPSTTINMNLNQTTLDMFNKFNKLTFGLPLERGSIFQVKSDLADKVSEKIFSSWRKSLEVVVSRIPAQSQQSFMPMDIVAYNDASKNDMYVSISQIFLQGSDFDIDKGYVMGHSFNNKGQYNTWSNLTNYNNLAQLEALNKLPKPTGRDINVIRDASNFDSVLSTEYNNIINSGEIDLHSLNPEVINSFNNMIRHINRNNLESLNINPQLEVVGLEFEVIADLINRHNTISQGRDYENSLKNKVVSGIQDIISDPANQVIANSPITIADWHQVVAEANARRPVPKVEPIAGNSIFVQNSPYDLMTYYTLQHNAAVGKDGVGIAANGVKAFATLTDYFNNYYSNPNITSSDLITSNKYFDKTFEYTLESGKTIGNRVNTVADIQISRDMAKKLSSLVDGQYIANYSDAFLILSGLLSAATDNAKELLLAQINATPELFSMHIYLAVMGMSMPDIVNIMTSDLAMKVSKRLEHNMFTDSYAPDVKKIFESMQRFAQGDIEKKNLETFIDIYYSSKELSALSGLLGINQKRKANPWEIYQYLARFENIFDGANDRLFTRFFENDKAVEDFKKSKWGKDTEAQLVDAIYKANESKAENPEYARYVNRVVRRAGHLSQEGLDFRKYFTDPQYQQNAVDYYNLIKSTFNVFDVMNEVPHFKGMLDSLHLSHEMMLNTSEKYNFIYGWGKDVIHKGREFDSKYDKKFITKRTTDNLTNMFNGAVAQKWLKDRNSSFNLNLKSLMREAGVNEFTLYTEKSISDIETKGNTRRITLDDASNPRISLDSVHGIANFKSAMEHLVLPILKKHNKSEFIRSLKLESLPNQFGLDSNAIVSTYSLQDLNTFQSLAKFDELIKDFDYLDTDNNLKGKFKNNVDAPLRIRDMFFLYNMLVHQEKYGNKKLTPLLENYMRETDSLGYEYVKYYSEVDRGNIDIFEDFRTTHGSEWRQKLDSSIFFHLTNTEGEATFIDGGKQKTIKIGNPDVVVMTDADMNIKTNKVLGDINTITNLIKEKGWVVRLEC